MMSEENGGDSFSGSRSQSLPLNQGGSEGEEHAQVVNLGSQDLQLQSIFQLVNQVRNGSRDAISHREKCSQVLGAVQLAYSALEWYAQSSRHQQLPKFMGIVQKDLEIGNMLVRVYGQHGAVQKATTVFSLGTIRQKFDRIINSLDATANEIWRVREFEVEMQSNSGSNEAPTASNIALAPATTTTTTTTPRQQQVYVNSRNLTSCCIQKGHYRNLINKWLFSTHPTSSMAFVPDLTYESTGMLWWVHNNCIYLHDITDESTKEVARPDDFQGSVDCMALDSDRGVVWLGCGDGRVAVFNDSSGELIAPTVEVGKGQMGVTALTAWQLDSTSFALVACENGAIYSYRLDKAPRSSGSPGVLNRGKQLSFLSDELERVCSSVPSQESRQRSSGEFDQRSKQRTLPDLETSPDAESDTQSEVAIKLEDFNVNTAAQLAEQDTSQRTDQHSSHNKGLRAHKGQVHCLLYTDGNAWSCGGISQTDCCIRLWQNVSRNNVEITFKLLGHWVCGHFGSARCLTRMAWPPLPTNPQHLKDIQQQAFQNSYRILSGHENGQVLMWDVTRKTYFQPVLIIGETYSPVRGIVNLSDLGIVAVGHANGVVKLRRLSHKLHKYHSENEQDEIQQQQSHRLVVHRPKTAELPSHQNGMLFCVGAKNTIVTSGWYGNVRLFPEAFLRNELEREDIPVLPIQSIEETANNLSSNSFKDVSKLLRHMTPTTQRMVISLQNKLNNENRRQKNVYVPQLGTINSDSELRNSNGSNQYAPNNVVPTNLIPGIDVSDAPRESSFSTEQSASKMSSQEIDLYNEFLVDYNDLKFLSELGDGSFGRVHKALLDETVVAVKILQAQFLGELEIPDDDSRDEPMYNLIKEVSVLYSIRHPNVVNFMGLCRSPPCLITEFCERGSLFDVLQEYRKGGMDKVSNRHLQSWHRRIQMLLHAARGMLTLHRHRPPIVHRDLKSPNLLVAKDWTVKVADFNLSRFLDTSTVVTKATPNNPLWQAPEVIKGDKFSRRTDVYAFGIVMWEVMTAMPPWGEDVHYFAVMQALINDDSRPSVGPELEILGGDWKGQKQYVDLMQQCWATNPTERPDFTKITQSLNRLEKLAIEWEEEQQQLQQQQLQQNIPSFRSGSNRMLEIGLTQSTSAQYIQEQINNQYQQGKHVTFVGSNLSQEEQEKPKFTRQQSGKANLNLGQEPSIEGEEGDFFASPFGGLQDFPQNEEIPQIESISEQHQQQQLQSEQKSANADRQLSQQDSIAAFFTGGNPFAANSEFGGAENQAQNYQN